MDQLIIFKIYIHVLTEWVGCPVMENEKIVQQPVDLTTLQENCDTAAVKFIKESAGNIKFMLCLKQPFIIFSFHNTQLLKNHSFCTMPYIIHIGLNMLVKLHVT